MSSLELLKIRNVKSPNRGTSHSAGIDFYMPEFDEDFLMEMFMKNKKVFYFMALNSLSIKDFETFVESVSLDITKDVLIGIKLLCKQDNTEFYFELPALKDFLIPSGIKTKFLNGVFIAFNKGGVATKQKLTVGACVDDEDFMGELFIHVVNSSDEPQRITLGNKLVQFLYMPINYDIPVIKENITSEEFYVKVTDRGEGCLGSTSIK